MVSTKVNGLVDQAKLWRLHSRRKMKIDVGCLWLEALFWEIEGTGVQKEASYTSGNILGIRQVTERGLHKERPRPEDVF